MSVHQTDGTYAIHRRTETAPQDLPPTGIDYVHAPVDQTYRRLDPNFEAPNQIMVSPKDRGAMVRIPIANEKSARIEVRSIGPDANPYLAIYALLRAGTDKSIKTGKSASKKAEYLPDNIYDAISFFQKSRFAKQALGERVRAKFAELKLAQAERCPRALGTRVKRSEVIFHHEVTNQYLWTQF